MIARVIPLVRLPNIKAEFDYEVPKTLESSIAVGQLVVVPFRKSDVFGLVFSLAEQTSELALKPISRIVIDEPLYTAARLSHFETLSHVYHINLSTLMLSSMPPLQKTKLKQSVAQPFPSHIDNAKTLRWYGYTTAEEYTNVLSEETDGYTVIVVPSLPALDEVLSHLPESRQSDVVVWHAGLTERELFTRWWQIRNGEKKIIIGTRSVLWLPFFQLDTILLAHEHDEGHKQTDQIPRAHARDVATTVAQLYGAQLVYTSYTPSTQTFFGVRKSTITGDLTLVPTSKPQQIVNLEDEWKKGKQGALSDSVHDHIAESSGNVLCYINRTGFAQAVVCKSCHQTIVCSVCGGAAKYFDKTATLSCQRCKRVGPLPKQCPACQHPILHFAGIGTERLEKELKERYGKTHRIVRFDGTVDADLFLSYRERTIFIGTRAILSRVPYDTVETIVYVDVDSELQLPEYTAHEGVWHTIATFNYARSVSSMLFIQTHNLKHIVLRSLTEPERWYRTELQTRKLAGYPPYQYLARLLVPGETLEDSLQRAQRYYAHISATLTEKKSDCILEKPYPLTPSMSQRRHWHAMIVRIPALAWVSRLTLLNTLAGAEVKVDPNPVNLLSF